MIDRKRVRKLIEEQRPSGPPLSFSRWKLEDVAEDLGDHGKIIRPLEFCTSSLRADRK
jgi:hypothetical protein